MVIYYSKPSSDIQKESSLIFKNERRIFQRQNKISKLLLACKDRRTCILCANKLRGKYLIHRGIPIIICDTCGHVQTRALPPLGYPGIDFQNIYPRLKIEEYRDRQKRIYQPKLDWIFSSLKEAGVSKRQIISCKWLEIGCGAGYFLSCLQDAGIKRFKGIDSDRKMVNIAEHRIKGKRAQYYIGDISSIIERFPSDIYVAFFVLEHLPNARQLFLKMRTLAKGTILVFSVPVFGLSCLLEGVYQNNFARNLDCVLHTQLYSDSSMRYAMHLSNFKIISQWVFGEDAIDFSRFLLTGLSKNYSKKLIADIQQQLFQLQDPLQAILDRQHFSDARHIIAIKN